LPCLTKSYTIQGGIGCLPILELQNSYISGVSNTDKKCCLRFLAGGSVSVQGYAQKALAVLMYGFEPPATF